MSTILTMVTRIQDELQRPDLTSQCVLAIKSSVEFYETERFYFSESRTTRDTVASQEYYGLPNDFQEPDRITFFPTSTTKYDLIHTTWAELESWHINTNYTGYPTHFAIYAQQLRLYPVPNGTYRLEFGYGKSLSELTATSSVSGGSSNAWTTDAEQLIRLHSKVDLLENVIRGPDAEREAARLRIREGEFYSRLIGETNSRRSTNRLKPTKLGVG